MATGAAVLDLSATGVEWRPLAAPADGGLAVDGILPRVLATPRDAEQLAALLRFASERRLGVIPRGAGTKMALGRPPERADVLLSMERLNQIVEYQAQDLTATVQAGCPLTSLQAELGRAGQYLPINPPHAARGTIGGMIATNAGGPWRLGHGGLRDMVIGTRAVLPDGTVARAGGKVVKNVAGYDLNKLYIGSLGTLAVMLEVTFKLTPRPKSETTVLAGFASAEAAVEVVARLARSPLMPRAGVLLDPVTAHTLSGVPPGSFLLLIAYAGLSPVLRRQEAETEQFCREAQARSIDVLAAQPSQALWEAVAEFPADPPDVVAKVSVPPGRVLGALAAVAEAGRSLQLAPAVAAQVASGILYVRLPAGLETAAAAGALGRLREACAQLGGTLVLWSAGPGLKRALDPWGPPTGPIGLMRKLKAEFDPQGILNPGRYVEGI
jgi:glycolate oxidase FAD binding subunit